MSCLVSLRALDVMVVISSEDGSFVYLKVATAKLNFSTE